MHPNPILRGLLVVMMVAACDSRAAVFCVDDATHLQSALYLASTNSQNNTIKVRAGTYRAPDGGFTYRRQGGRFNLDLEGGWNAHCTEQTQDASLTVLDGGSVHNIIDFEVFDHTSTARVTLRYFDFYHGVDQRGFSPIVIETEAGNARLENSRIRGNTSTDQYAVIAAIGNYGGGNIYFLDNVVADNYAERQSTVMSFDVQGGGALYFNNNTVTANRFGPSAPVEATLWFTRGSLANNILWANTASTEIATQTAPLLLDNDIDVFDLTPAAGSAGNIDADPRFMGPSNRRLQADSPACDAGDNTPPGTTRSIDLDGNPRRVRAVDMGAYERQGPCD